MQPRVTAILVARNGAQHLERTLEALRAQTRQPDTVVLIDCGSTDGTSGLLAAFGATHFLAADADFSFGQAIAAALGVLGAPTSDKEMLWLIAQDSAPEPNALSALLGELEISPSVAVAGPKVMEWEAAEYINNFGLSITSFGTTVNLVEAELDQGQHDGVSDVLAVSAGGMLVRHAVWNELGGFDPGLPVVDDSVDFCIRVRLAGYRVSVVPTARVASAEDGVAGPNGSSRGRARRKRLRAGRAAQLHRRLVYAPSWALPFHWLSLLPLALVRAIGQLLRKEPGAIAGEFSAAVGAAVHGRRVRAARRRLAASKRLGWGAIASLRVESAEVRRRHALTREANLAGVRGAHPDIRFFAAGGAWTTLAAAAVGVAVMSSLLGARTLTGGGLLPLDDSVAGLWRNATYGWRDIGLGFVGAADPFAAVLALLGSMTFWEPSFALVILYFVAFPLAAVGAWMAASRLTERPSVRATAAVLWVLAPTFLSALAAGRPAAILVHLLLPWLFFAGAAAARSWSASASAALLFAAVAACAPSLAPALLIGWLICLLISGRRIMRFVGIPIPALALALPLILDQGLRGRWLSLLADPGAPVPAAAAPVWQLALGFPVGHLGGLPALVESLGAPPVVASLAVPVLYAPLAILAVLALVLPGARSAGFALVAALLGFGTAVFATHLQLSHVGADPVGVWPGSGLSLYWLGIVGAAVIALRGIRRFDIAPALVVSLTALVAAAPLAVAIPMGTSDIAKGSERTLPAFVTAEAQTADRVGTLELDAQRDGGIRATVVRGPDTTLNEQSTVYSTDTTLSGAEKRLADLAGNLASSSGLDASKSLDAFGIRFVLLRPAEEDAPNRQVETQRRTASALDGNAAVAPVGDTAFGRLWRHEAGSGTAEFGAVPGNAGDPARALYLALAALVIGITVLLSIPTGAGSEAVRQANRDAIRRAARANANARANDRASTKARLKAGKGKGRRRKGDPGNPGTPASAPVGQAQDAPALVGADQQAGEQARIPEPQEADDAH